MRLQGKNYNWLHLEVRGLNEPCCEDTSATRKSNSHKTVTHSFMIVTKRESQRKYYPHSTGASTPNGPQLNEVGCGGAINNITAWTWNLNWNPETTSFFNYLSLAVNSSEFLFLFSTRTIPGGKARMCRASVHIRTLVSGSRFLLLRSCVFTIVDWGKSRVGIDVDWFHWNDV